jgi:hypothetical protein
MNQTLLAKPRHIELGDAFAVHLEDGTDSPIYLSTSAGNLRLTETLADEIVSTLAHLRGRDVSGSVDPS